LKIPKPFCCFATFGWTSANRLENPTLFVLTERNLFVKIFEKIFVFWYNGMTDNRKEQQNAA